MTDFTLADIERVLETGSHIIVETSGSTGIPKRVRVSATALRASAEATATSIGQGQWVLALPTSYIAGIQVLVRSVLAGTQPVSLPPGPFRTRDFVAATAQLTAPGYVSLVPAQLRSLLGNPDGAQALAQYEAVLVGGQRVPSELVEQCDAGGIRLVRTYGSTETSGGCVYDGYALNGVTLRIADGEVQVSGATLADGYVDAAGELIASPVFIEEGGVRWYRTGDLGAISAEGELSISGRADRVLISGGVNVSLDRLEGVLRQIPGLEQAVVVAVAHERWGHTPRVVVPGAASDDEQALLAAARDLAEREIGPAAKPHDVVLVPVIPITPSGKPDYTELDRRFGA